MIIVNIIIFCAFVYENDAAIAVFNLSSYNRFNKSTHIIKRIVSTNSELLDGYVVNKPAIVAFYLIQIHCDKHNVTLSPNKQFFSGTAITGTNVGLVFLKNDVPRFFVKTSSYPSQFLIVVAMYEEEDPIPGGCNLSFDTEIAPYQHVSFDNDLIFVSSQPPSIQNASCSLDKVDVDFYHMFLHQHNYLSEKYYEGLQKMLSVDDIRTYGRKVRFVEGYFKYKKLYNRYTGTGEVFAVVATYRNRSSAYVPAVSYGCDTYNWSENCTDSLITVWSIICLVIGAWGVFMCFYGHKFFRLNLYSIGFIFGVVLTNGLLSYNEFHNFEEKSTFSLLNGLVYGFLWLFIWDKFGLPLLSVGLLFSMAGFLISSTIFYSGLADTIFYENDINYTLIILCIILSFMIVFTLFTVNAHIFACTYLGSYGIILALNHFFGGHLRYIWITSYRRITVKHFGKAIIDPPFQILDLFHTILWIILTASGFFYQWRQQRGKPPFPHPQTVVEEGITENTALIRNHSNPSYT